MARTELSFWQLTTVPLHHCSGSSGHQMFEQGKPKFGILDHKWCTEIICGPLCGKELAAANRIVRRRSAEAFSHVMLWSTVVQVSSVTSQPEGLQPYMCIHHSQKKSSCMNLFYRLKEYLVNRHDTYSVDHAAGYLHVVRFTQKRKQGQRKDAWHLPYYDSNIQFTISC